MEIIPIKTRIMQPPKDDLYNLLDEYLPEVREQDVLIVTSKVMAIHEGRCVCKKGTKNKHDLAKQEADGIMEYENMYGKEFLITLIQNAFLSSAGIDESNGDGYYVLLPKDPWKLCKEIWEHIREKHGVKEVAVIAVDSHSLPLRYGALGISIGYFGLNPLKHYVGKEDLFGRPFKVERTNVIDAIAAVSTLVMGEGSESQPLAIVRDVPGIKFVDCDTRNELLIPAKEDIYSPFIELFNTRKK